MVDSEHGDDEIEGAVGQRVLEAAEAEVGGRQALARTGEHRLACVEAGPRGVGVQGEHAQRGLARAGPELEHGADLEPVGCCCRGGLELFVAGDLVQHLGEIRLGIPLEAGYGL
jgi:hypothetical protein